MKTLHLTASLALFAMLFTSSLSHAQIRDDTVEPDGRRLAQTGMKFLSVTTDPRAAALADAVTSYEGTSAAMLWNTAGMARIEGTLDISLGQTQWIGDTKYNSATAAFSPAGGVYGVFGVSIMSVQYGEFEETIRADNEQGFIDLGTFSPSALAVGVGYARALTDRFSVGGNVKYARQSLGSAVLRLGENGSQERRDHEEGVVAFDMGTIYHTGFRSLVFAMSLQNFSREVTYAEESFELPLTFRIGASMDMLDFARMSDNHDFVLSVDAQRPRDYAEQLKIGGEYTFMDLISLRAGYAFPTDEEALSLGAGVKTNLSGFGFGADYAFTQFGAFGDVNRLAFHLSF